MDLVFLVGIVEDPHVGALGSLDNLKLEETAALLGGAVCRGLPASLGLCLYND